MAVGAKARATVIVFAALLLLTPIHVRAESVSELYDLYGIDYEVDIPTEILETIRAYNYAKRYVSMYNYVTGSDFDKAAIESEIAELQCTVSQLRDVLLSGYSISDDLLASYEDEYSTCVRRLEDLQSSLVSYELEGSPIDINNVPTYSEYVSAVREKNDILDSADIGTLQNLQVPVQSSARLISSDDNVFIYRVVDDTGTLSLFSGEVTDVSVEDSSINITVDSGNGVVITYSNLAVAEVIPGDRVLQNQRLGYVHGNRFVMSLSLGETRVDLNTLFAEE